MIYFQVFKINTLAIDQLAGKIKSANSFPYHAGPIMMLFKTIIYIATVSKYKNYLINLIILIFFHQMPIKLHFPIIIGFIKIITANIFFDL